MPKYRLTDEQSPIKKGDRIAHPLTPKLFDGTVEFVEMDKEPWAVTLWAMIRWDNNSQSIMRGDQLIVHPKKESKGNHNTKGDKQ